MKKTKRILELLELVPSESNIVFDVGCDHGILSALMVSTGKAKSVYASDISEKSLEKTINLAKKLKMEDKIKCVVSDGLNSFDKTIKSDCIVIAGMGGNEIVKILTNIEDFTNYKSFLLQPAQDFYILRRYLSDNGFEIIKDEIIEDRGKFYSNILCCKSTNSQTLTNVQCHFGKFCDQDISVDFNEFVNYTYTKLFAIKDFLDMEDLEKLSFCKAYINNK